MSNVRPFDLRVKGLKYHVKDGVSIRTILDIEHLEIASGEVLGIRGTSGSGKSTFLKLISGIVTPQLGTVSWGNELLSHCSEARRDDWRGRNCGFLFQDFLRIFYPLILSRIFCRASYAMVYASSPVSFRFSFPSPFSRAPKPVKSAR